MINRCIRYGLVIAAILWSVGLLGAAQASAASVMNVLTGPGTNPLYDFGTAVGISGGNKFIAGDFDGDGDTDLANRNPTNTGVQYWRNNGDGTITELNGASNPFKDVTFPNSASNFSAMYLLTGDLDGDGDQDVFNEYHDGQPALYRNDGGSFTVLQGAGTNPLDAFGLALGGGKFRAIAADFDGDGDTDLVNRNSTSTGVQYWRNNGDGTFTELTGTGNPLASVTFASDINSFTAPLLAAGDFDGDGDIDIYNGNHGGAPAMYRNDGGTFTVLQGPGTNPLHDFGMTVGATSGKFVAGDFNGDGFVDLANRNAANTGVQFWNSNGDGTFTELTGSGNPFGDVTFSANVNYFHASFLGVGDFDGDGDTDLVNVNHGGIPALYQQSGVTGDPSLQLYPVRAGAAPSTSYTLSVNGQSVFVEKFGDISFARFAFSGTANVQVNASEAVASFGISPLSDQINGSSDGNGISFAIDQPKSLIVSVNNLEKLLLFADGMENDAPDIQDPNVINLADYLPANRDEDAEVTAYFQQAIDDTSAMNNGAGGILYVPDGKYMTAQLKLKSNVHLYLQDGAWIRAVPQFNATNYPAQNNGDSSFIYIGNASHVKISGRGIIDGNGMTVRTLNAGANIKLLRTAEVTDLDIEDVYFLDSARWTLHLLYTQDVVLKNIKIINDLRGAPDPNDPNVWLPTVTNTDGVDIDASQNVTVDGAFIYTGDDAISPKVTNYMNLKRPTLGLQIKNNVLWSLKAALKVGDETLMDIGDIQFNNNDIIHADRFIALWNREESRIHDIEAIDNRAEFIGGNYNERYFYFRIRTNGANSNPGWIDQVLVKDFYALNMADQPSTIEGYDSSHLVTNVTFDNIVINGNQAAGIADVPLDFRNEFYDNVVFQPSGTVYSGTTESEARVLLVDQRGLTSGAYTSISEAVASTPALKPGDMISLVPGSGPYHESILLQASGAPGNPIVIDGNGELISGFVPFQFTQESDGQWTYTLPEPIANTLPDGSSNTFRHLIAYNGQRLLLDQAYGQNAGVFTSDYAVLSSDGSKLILNPDKASPTSGWEISTLQNGVEIVNSGSYQTYRNLRVTGMQNDGFNIHGTGTGLVFENIEAFNNFDEGFSSHDSTASAIEGGKFWGNENGIYNMSRDTVTFTANNVEVYNNIGYGIATQMGTNSFSNVQVWDNGISNMRVGGRVYTSNVATYDSRWSQRPWVGYQETQNYKYNQQIKPYAYSEYVKTDYPIEKSGTPPTVLPAAELPPFKGSFEDWRHVYFSIAQHSDPSVSGPDADPDGDGLSNQVEYEEGLNPNIPDQNLPPVSANTSLEGPASVQAGQTLDVTYGLVGVASNVYAQQVTVHYNPDQLQYVGADSLLDDFTVVDAIDDDGRIDIVVAGLHASVTGSTDMLTFHFRALVPMQTESSQVVVSQAIVSDQDGNESELGVGPAYQVQIVSSGDKSALQAKIAEAQAILGGASVGDHWGQYGQNEVDAFNVALQQAMAIYNDTEATQVEVEQAIADLAAAMQAFAVSVKTTASIGDIGIMASRYGISSADADWSVVKRYDLNGDSSLDTVDLTAMAGKILGR